MSRSTSEQRPTMTSRPESPEPALLDVSGLTVTYERHGQPFHVLDDLSFSLGQGRILGVVGESGSGKTTLAMILIGMAKRIGASVTHGEVRVGGEDILQASPQRVRQLRREAVGLIVQDPHSALNPAFQVGTQVEETVRFAEGGSRTQRHNRAVSSLDLMRLPDPASLWRRYPHQLSGGMKQRVVGGIGIVNRPRLLIADEPTTALDVTIQSQYLALLRDLRDTLGISIIIITHDLGVIAELCDEVMVLYAGRIVESASVVDLFDDARHPYSKGLLKSRLDFAGDAGSRRLPQIPGQPPRLWNLPVGCSFRPRCDEAEQDCAISAGPLMQVSATHLVECRVAARAIVDRVPKARTEPEDAS